MSRGVTNRGGQKNTNNGKGQSYQQRVSSVTDSAQPAEPILGPFTINDPPRRQKSRKIFGLFLSSVISELIDAQVRGIGSAGTGGRRRLLDETSKENRLYDWPLHELRYEKEGSLRVSIGIAPIPAALMIRWEEISPNLLCLSSRN